MNEYMGVHNNGEKVTIFTLWADTMDHAHKALCLLVKPVNEYFITIYPALSM